MEDNCIAGDQKYLFKFQVHKFEWGQWKYEDSGDCEEIVNENKELVKTYDDPEFVKRQQEVFKRFLKYYRRRTQCTKK